MSRRKIIIFEKLNCGALLVASVARILNYELFFLGESRLVEKLKAFHLKEALNLKAMPQEPLPYLPLRVGFMRQALDCIEAVYKRNFSSDGLIDGFIRHLRTEIIAASYKKVLLERLGSYFQTKYILESARQKFKDDRIIFCPLDFFTVKQWVKDDKAVVADLVPWWAFCFSGVLSFVEQAKWVLMFLIFPVSALFKIRAIVRPLVAVNYRAAMRVYKTDWAFENKYRTIDFLVDGKDLNHKNTLFCIETPISAEYRQELENRSYTVVDISGILRTVTPAFLKNVFLKSVLVLWARSLVHVFYSAPLFIRLSLENLSEYLKWQRFLEEYRVNYYVAYNDRGTRHIIRNILFSQKGIESLLYAHTCHSNDLFETSSDEIFLDSNFAYLYFDHLICWGEQLKRYYLAHPNHIKNTMPMGCLWSEHVRLIENNEIDNELFKKLRNGTNKKVIGVFDTTFWNVVLTSDEMYDFMRGISRLTEDIPGLQLILKHKWAMKDMIACNVPKLEKVYSEFENHKDCMILNAEKSDAAEVIAVSDLVISACFTSPTIEAVGAHKKGIYFDPYGRFKGTYYDSIPYFLAHNYEELREMVKHWLYESDEASFDKWIGTYIKNEIDYHADGKAIMRFREYLTSGRG